MTRMCAMPSMSATARSAASEIQPSCCSCSRLRIAITADCCRPSGIFAICCFAHARFSSVMTKLSGCCSFGAKRRTDISFSRSSDCGYAQPSSVHLAEHDVEGAKDGGDVGQQVALADEVHRLQMRETRRADLALVRLDGAVGDEIDAELALRRFNGGVDFASRNVNAFGVELEVVDQRFHRALHLATARRRDLVVLTDNGPLPVRRAQLGDALLHDTHRLVHL